MEKTQEKPAYGILVILMVGAFFTLLSNTLLNVALPSIMKDFAVSAATVQWLSTGYMLMNGILIPTSAFLIKKFSVRNLFLTAISLFTIGTLLGGLAHIFPALLIARMVQAAGAAIMMPLLMNVLYTMFPPEKRGSAMGLLGLVLIFAPAIGPTLSGWIIQNYAWPTLFFMMVPFLVLVWALGFFKLHDKKEKTADKIDVLSVILAAIGFGGILYGFSSAGNDGWASPNVYGAITVGIIGLILFITRQLKMDEPMLDFRVYQSPMFALSSAISITLNMAMYSAMILLPIYLQNIRGISAFDSGLLMLPGAMLMGIMSPITGRLFDAIGPKILAFVGLSILVFTTFQFSNLTDTTTKTHLLMLYAGRMFGISMVMMPIMTNGLNSLSARLTPHGTAMNSTMTQVSGAIGASLLVSIMSTRTATHAEGIAKEAMSKLDTVPVGDALAHLQQQVAMQATISGINDAFRVATGISIVALLLSFFLKRSVGGGRITID